MPTSSTAKLLFLGVCRAIGMFHLSRWLTRRRLRILCYHAFELEDETRFRPKLFISPEAFQRRLQFLNARGFPILPLEQALGRLDAGSLPDCATVITIDDGWHGVAARAAPILSAYSMPFTLYVTTYYVAKGNPVFRMAVQYMFWKTKEKRIDLADLGYALAGDHDLQNPASSAEACERVIRHGERNLSEQERVSLGARLGAALKVDYDHMRRSRVLSMVTVEELRALNDAGVDIQLHTHRHSLGTDGLQLQQELAENRAVLEPIVGRRLRHFCYPSGMWHESHWPLLQREGVVSATTCEQGLNTTGTSKLALRRFLDGANISQVEFESEMCGFNEVLRAIRRQVRRCLP